VGSTVARAHQHAAAASRICPDAPSRQADDLNPGTPVGEAPRHCARDRWSPGGWTRNSALRRRAPRRGLFGSLTDREFTILRLLPGSGSPGELAADLFVSPNP
jgi:hypothetical protein